MVRIDASFLLVAVCLFILGIVMGIAMGIAHDFQLAPVHAHLNLVGFVSLAIFGLTYRAFPELSRSRLALPHFALSSAGAVLFPIGIYVAVAYQIIALGIVGSLLVLGGALLFLVNLVRSVWLRWPGRGHVKTTAWAA
jgi:hypothetical protein